MNFVQLSKDSINSAKIYECMEVDKRPNDAESGSQ